MLDWQRQQGWANRGERAAAGDAGERRIVAATDLSVGVDPVATAAAASGPAPAEVDELWRRVLRSVPARHARLLTLVYRDGLNQRQAAEHVGLSQPRASQLHAEAIGRLRRRWSEPELAELFGVAMGRRRVA